MVDRIFKEIVSIIEELEEEYGEEIIPYYGEVFRNILAKGIAERLGREVRDTEIFLACFFLIGRRNFEELEEHFKIEIQDLFDVFRKIEKKRW